MLDLRMSVRRDDALEGCRKARGRRGGGGVDVRIGAQGCGEAVEVGVWSLLGGFLVAVDRHFRCYLVPETVLAKR